jgi:hypothetical protein
MTSGNNLLGLAIPIFAILLMVIIVGLLVWRASVVGT